MNKLISFSLWGNDSKYWCGALKNAELAQTIYPDFRCRFYCNYSIPQTVIWQLEMFPNVEIVRVDEPDSFLGYFWRNRAINEADVVLIRDVDSRLSEREKVCVDKWLESDFLFTTIVDHPFHATLMMPGLSGYKRSDLNFVQEIEQFFVANKDKNLDQYSVDYWFYSSIFHKIEPSLLRFDSIFGRGESIPHKRQGLEFCGKIFDGNEKTVSEHEQVLQNWLNKKNA